MKNSELTLHQKIFLKIVKEKLLPKHNLDISNVSFELKNGQFSVYYLTSKVNNENLLDYYEKTVNFYKEANLLSKSILLENLYCLKVFTDYIKENEQNLLFYI